MSSTRMQIWKDFKLLILTASPIKSPCRGYITVHPHLHRWRVSLENRKEEQADVEHPKQNVQDIQRHPMRKLFRLGFR
jgi:hypothetical protein